MIYNLFDTLGVAHNWCCTHQVLTHAAVGVSCARLKEYRGRMNPSGWRLSCTFVFPPFRFWLKLFSPFVDF